MATYKVLQDIEAEDKLVGPLTLRQCIYAAIAILAGYLAFLAVTKGAAFMAIFLLPFIAFGLFFAWPWSKQQSTEVWALAKVRFALKPRKRIWDQSGIKELVTVTAPKVVEDPRQRKLSETEVRSRLKALADTIDSRGWAVKNVPANIYIQPSAAPASDRLLDGSDMPREVPNYTTTASDDMFDLANNPIAQQFQAKITASSNARRQQLVNQINTPQPAGPATSAAQTAGQPLWHVPGPQTNTVVDSFVSVPQAATPTSEEEALAQEIKRKRELLNNPEPASSSGMRTIQPISDLTDRIAQALYAPAPQQTTPASEPATTPVSTQATTPAASANQAQPVATTPQQTAPEPSVTPPANPAILELANNNDLNVATIAREAQHRNPDGNEVVVSLH